MVIYKHLLFKIKIKILEQTGMEIDGRLDTSQHKQHAGEMFGKPRASRFLSGGTRGTFVLLPFQFLFVTR